MKAIKRTVAALLATLMLATSTSFTLAAENYTDDEAVVVAKVNAAGIMTGTDKGFEPSKSLTRAEAAAIIVRMKGISESTVKTSAGTTATFHNGTDYGTDGLKIPQYAIEDGYVFEAAKSNSDGANYVWVIYPRVKLAMDIVNNINYVTEGKKDKAAKAIAYAEKVIPTYNVPMNYLSGGIDFVSAYYALGQTKKGNETLNAMWKNSVQYMKWYCSLSQNRFMQSQRECMYHLYVMQKLIDVAEKYDAQFAEKKSAELDALATMYHSKGGSFGE